MDEPKPLDSLFKEKIFRIPDYQRGYAWQREQLKAFWEDLVNLSEGRSHYTGVLTLKEIPNRDVEETDKEFWLVEDHSYKVYNIVDGQQRLTTFIIFIQAFVEFVKDLPQNTGKSEAEVYLTDTQSVEGVQSRFLFKVKPTGDQFRTYKFGYTRDNPSYEYLRHRILGENGAGTVQETFYTLNLNNAKTYFKEQLEEMHQADGLSGLQDIYKKLTKRFLFNEYIIKDEFDVFVAFETMNNRGKKLSDLELLKNRLIYLTTLYSDEELDQADRQSLRETINDAWKEVYRQLGRNKTSPLNDDDFLRAHWILYFKYSRQDGKDYIRFLLDKQFTPQRIHKKVEREVALEIPLELRDEESEENQENGTEEIEETRTVTRAELAPTEIRDYVLSLKECAVHWFNSFFPYLADELADEERRWLDALNRVGIAYFRPILMSVLKNGKGVDERIRVYGLIEQFIFTAFRMNQWRTTYRTSEFFKAARELDRGERTMQGLVDLIEARPGYEKNKDGSFRSEVFYNILYRKFENGSGYYGWAGLNYFLYEYELSLLSESRQMKVDWMDLKKFVKDRVSIEHIFPQTPKDNWKKAFKEIPESRWVYYQGSLGNLLVLSMSINASLQNDDFEDKKKPRFNDAGKKIRNGYSDGSHSEIEVSAKSNWGPDEILERGMKLVRFMEKRWKIDFGSDDARRKILFLSFENDDDEINK